MGQMTKAVGGLLVANVTLFVLTMISQNPAGGVPAAGLGLWFPLNQNFAVWQFLTYMFMHGGFTHIFFNMFALFTFGVPLEIMWGTRRFLVFYFIAGLGAGIVYTGVNWFEFQSALSDFTEAGVSEAAVLAWLKSGSQSLASFPSGLRSAAESLFYLYHIPMVGASGAIYGLLVAFGLTFPNAKLGLLFVPVPIAAKYFIPALIGLDLLSGVTGFSIFGGGIAHFAHVGGAAIGFLLMWYWRKTLKPPQRFRYQEDDR
jgi:membrane associated rhomboid family serine protease